MLARPELGADTDPCTTVISLTFCVRALRCRYFSIGIAAAAVETNADADTGAGRSVSAYNH